MNEHISVAIAQLNRLAGAEPVARKDFEYALSAVKNGRRVARAGWNGKGMWVMLVVDKDTYIGPGNKFYSMRQFLAISSCSCEVFPWIPSQADLFAEDWEILP